MFFAIIIWLITLVSVVLTVGKYWWLPELASEHGVALDRQFMLTLVVTGIIFVLAQVALGYLVMRYKDRPGRTADYSHGNDKLEVVWTLATAVVFFALVIPGQSIWASLHLNPPTEDVVRIEVTGQQFSWNIRYPGADGKFGQLKPELTDDSGGNALGLDPDDPASSDDLVVPVMAVPVNRNIELMLRSKDVTHPFFVRELRIKQDAVPGMTIPLRFKPSKIGHYEVACAELCGLGHHKMRSTIQILSDEDYASWLKDQAEE